MTTAQLPEVQWLDPATLIPDEGNPRKIDPANRERLRALLDRFGLVETLVLNRATGELVSGHQRRDLALELGLDRVPVMVVDLTEAEARALAIALNNPGAQGEWEPGLLAARLDELVAFDVLDLTAFDAAELEAFAGFSQKPDETVSFRARKKGAPPSPRQVSTTLTVLDWLAGHHPDDKRLQTAVRTVRAALEALPDPAA